MAAFVQKVFETNLNFMCQPIKNQLRYIKALLLCQFLKVDVTIVTFSSFSNLLLPKIETCLNTFWTKNPKSGHCDIL